MITITFTADCSKSLVSPRLRGDSATGAGALSMAPRDTGATTL